MLLSEDPINGVRNEVTVATANTAFLLVSLPMWLTLSLLSDRSREAFEGNTQWLISNVPFGLPREHLEDSG